MSTLSTTITTNFAKARKAVGAGVLAGAAALVASLDGGITSQEWGVIVGAVIAAALGVYGIKNEV